MTPPDAQDMPVSTQPAGDTSSAENAFREYLHQRGIRMTEPRRLVLKAAIEREEHFEAEQLLFALRRRGERVARATIYRTLPLLVDSGILRRVHFNANQAHYRRSFGERPRDHMFCERCGRIDEFDSQQIVHLIEQIARKRNFKAASHRFQIRGYCSDCAAVIERRSRT